MEMIITIRYLTSNLSYLISKNNNDKTKRKH